MVDLKSITNLATLGLGAYIFFKVWPTVQGALGGLGGAAQIPTPQRIAPIAPPIDVPAAIETIVAASVVPGSPIGVGQQEFAVPDVSAQLAALQQQIAAMPLVQQPVTAQPLPFAPVGSTPLGIGALPPRPAIVAAPPPTGGQFWINPLTQAVLAPYVAGQLPASVSALRAEDIYPAIRGF